MFPLIARRPQLFGCAVGRRLRREDEWVGLGDAALIASADYGPAVMYR
jgi:hypothetical protein